MWCCDIKPTYSRPAALTSRRAKNESSSDSPAGGNIVNFATLGYGDIVMSERWRLLGPLEAANGILMFGVSTSVMTAAVMDVIKYKMARLQLTSANKR